MQIPGRLALILGLVIGSELSSQAAEIVLKNGAHYSKVIILRRTPTTLKMHTSFGEITLQGVQIATVDGQPFDNPPPAATPAPELVETTPEPTATPEVIEKPSVVAEETPAPARVATPILSAPIKTPAPHPVYQHSHEMDWKLGGIFLAILLYLTHLVWVQHQMNRRSKPAWLWNSIVFLLPVVGFLLFLAVNALVGRNKKAYGGKEDIAAAAKKRPLFSFKNRNEQPKGQGIGLRFVDETSQTVSTLGKKESGLETAREILEAAVVQRASDIHIEPQEELCRVRFRVDGQLAEHRVLGPTEGIRLITSLKSLAGIDVAEKRKAQDGRFHVKTDIREVDFRVATANSIHGEKIVIRILDRKGGLLSLDQVGMSADLESVFDRTIRSRAGMIIVTGPTGSGKTSTLYAALSRLDREKLNIMTIEDPVEYELPGATQIPVAPKAGTTYESGLRSILRQDPDVILVGEMRDAEAATVAIRAALTGHLVFTSLHTRDSIATLIRLEEMGMERSQMASALIMLVAQRLVRVLCPECRNPVTSTGEELIDIGIEWEPGATIYESAGCPDCEGTGFRGRTGIFEVLVLNDGLRQAVQQGASQEDILTMARQNGFRPYREDGATKVLLGITTISEVKEAT
ncbi:MAG: ATPase, T2SS/T4P/T4SS family [Chthoniobacterales bacterium]